MKSLLPLRLPNIGLVSYVGFFSLFLTSASALSQGLPATNKWLGLGSLRSFYSSRGCEIEIGRPGADQQDGLQWQGLYKHQDMEAAKGLWIGVNPHTFPDNSVGPYVVHVGPRALGTNEFFPVKFEMVSKYAPSQVLVNGDLSEGSPVDNDRVDATIPCDRMIVNVVNTAAGITMTRKIMQFSQQYHDNYMIYDYVFKNTGNTNADATIEQPSQTLTGVYFYWQYRYAVCWDTRYVIGQNPTGWGINTMNDTRGDGNNPATPFFVDPTGNGINYNVRAQYSWHGKYPPFTLYDNIGGPIWTPYWDKTDTVGRLGAAQFVGNAAIHADRSAADKTDDLTQPSTMSYEGSDEPNNSQNDHLNSVKDGGEYAWMMRGRVSPRHADKIGPAGDPSGGIGTTSTSGGQSSATGFGPYTLAPGDSVHIVIVEAAAGLDREACVAIGRAYRASGGNNAALITYNGVSKTKNDWVYTGRDSLFKTFNRAIANYNAGFVIPKPPPPPATFSVNSGAGAIKLEWTSSSPGDPAVLGYQIYRAVGRYDSAYHMIYSGGPATLSFSDTTATIDVAHFYYLVSVGDPAANNSPSINPTGTLVSNRSYSQTYDPAYRRVAAPLTLDASAIRIVPNPYVISSSNTYVGEPDKIVFKNLPGTCTIRVYTELGELITKLDHTDNTNAQDWVQTTSSKQIIVSGVYIAVIETPTGERAIKKFVVIR